MTTHKLHERRTLNELNRWELAEELCRMMGWGENDAYNISMLGITKGGKKKHLIELIEYLRRAGRKE